MNLLILLSLAAAAAADEDPRRLMIRGTFDDSPFVVALMICSANNIYRCGAICTGSLIAPNLVLSAAHCVRDQLVPYASTSTSDPISKMYILVGSQDLRDLPSHARLVKVKSVKFGTYGTNIRFPYDGDISLLELEDCVSEIPGQIEYIQVATRATEPPGGDCRNVTVHGYGQMSNAPSEINDTDGRRKFITDKLHSSTVCRNAYIALDQGLQSPNLSNVRGDIFYAVTPDTQICSGGPTRHSVCFGDSGGPTVASIDLSNPNSTLQVIGVTSFGFGGDSVDSFCTLGPDFSLRVSTYAPWIVDQLSSFTQCPGWSWSSSFTSWPVAPVEFTEAYTGSRCQPQDGSKWQCKSGSCINASQVCDNSKTCSDNSDESYTIDGLSICSTSSTRKSPLLEEFEALLTTGGSVTSKSASQSVRVKSLDDHDDGLRDYEFVGILTSAARSVRIPKEFTSPKSKAAGPRIACGDALGPVLDRIQADKAADTIDDLWDSSASLTVCANFQSCLGTISGSDFDKAQKFCTSLLKFDVFNSTTMPRFDGNFATNFNSSCPDDYTLDIFTRVEDPSSAGMIAYTLFGVVLMALMHV